MSGFIFTIMIIFVAFLSITYILHRFFKNIKFIKYLPSLLSFIGSMYYFILAKRVPGVEFSDLANAVVALLFFTGFISGLLSALCLDFVAPLFKRK